MQCSTHFCNACGKQSPLSFVTGLQTTIETGKAIIEEIVPQALKSYQHEGWDWLGGHLWPHALSWHEVALAIACQFPPAPGFPIPPPFIMPSYLVPFSPPTPPPLSKKTKKKNPLCACYCPRMETINRTTKRRIKSVLFAEYATKLKACNHTALFPIMMELIVDTSWGENLFDSALIE